MGSIAELRGEHPLVVYIDLKSPYAFIAIGPTRDMARGLGIEVEWRPFTLDIPSYLGSARLDSKGRVAESKRTPQQWSGVRYAYKDARRYAALTGKTLRGTEKIWDSSLAGIGMLWAKRHSAAILDAYLDASYERFWRRDLDIEDLAVIEARLAAAGADRAGFREFATGAGRREHDEINRAAFDAGIFGVPSYLVGDECFFGREHLPIVEWLLAGEPGAMPDVANRGFAPSPAPTPVASLTCDSIDVVIDARHASVWLGLEPILEMADTLGCHIDWWPHVASPLVRPPAPRADDDRGTRHRRIRNRMVVRELERHAAARGHELLDPYLACDPAPAHLGLLWATRRGDPRDYLRGLADGFWTGSLALDDLQGVEGVLRGAGFATDGFAGFASGEGATELAANAARFADLGLFAVPAYRVGDEVFYGRQHLPMLRWRLTGERGPVPI